MRGRRSIEDPRLRFLALVIDTHATPHLTAWLPLRLVVSVRQEQLTRHSTEI